MEYQIHHGVLTCHQQRPLKVSFHGKPACAKTAAGVCCTVSKHGHLSYWQHDLSRIKRENEGPEDVHPVRNEDISSNSVVILCLIAFTMVFGAPIVYAGQEQHYSGGEDPANREALWLSGFDTDSELYKLIATANGARNQVIAKGTDYIIYQVCVCVSVCLKKE